MSFLDILATVVGGGCLKVGITGGIEFVECLTDRPLGITAGDAADKMVCLVFELLKLSGSGTGEVEGFVLLEKELVGHLVDDAPLLSIYVTPLLYLPAKGGHVESDDDAVGHFYTGVSGCVDTLGYFVVQVVLHPWRVRRDCLTVLVPYAGSLHV